MKCVVTGASGFIGSYLCRYLINQGVSVTGIARSFSPKLRGELESVHLIEADILSEDFPRLTLFADAVIHLAAANDVVSRDSWRGMELSVLGTKHALDFAVHNNISRFMFFSTFQVYGSEMMGLVSEDTKLNPENEYSLNHMFAEQYVEMYARKGKIHAVIVRPTNVYGRFIAPTINRWTLVPACFCKEAVEKQSMTLLSSGKQMRNFVSLENVSRTCMAVLNHFPHMDYINISSSTAVSILDVAKEVQSVYLERYGKLIDIHVKSHLPLESNPFQVSMKKLYDYGFVEDKGYSLQTEIDNIFKMLEQNKSE